MFINKFQLESVVVVRIAQREQLQSIWADIGEPKCSNVRLTDTRKDINIIIGATVYFNNFISQSRLYRMEIRICPTNLPGMQWRVGGVGGGGSREEIGYMSTTTQSILLLLSTYNGHTRGKESLQRLFSVWIVASNFGQGVIDAENQSLVAGRFIIIIVQSILLFCTKRNTQ